MFPKIGNAISEAKRHIEAFKELLKAKCENKISRIFFFDDIYLTDDMKKAIKYFKNTWSISHSTLLWLYTFILPLAFGLFFIKTYKLISVSSLDINTINTALLALTINQFLYSGVFIIIFIGVSIFLSVHRNLYGKYNWFLIKFLLIVSFFAGLLLIKLAYLCGMNVLKFIGTFKQDFLIILIYTYFSVILLESLSGRLRLTAKFILSIISTLFLLLIVIDLIFYTASNTQGDWFLLKFSIMNFSQVWALGGEELNFVHLLLLIFPLVLIFISLVVHRLPFIRRWLNNDKVKPAKLKLQVINWSVVLILLIGISQLLTPEKIFAGNAISKVGKGILSDIFFTPEDYKGIQDDDKDIFDSSQIELIKTDNTKLYNIVIILLESFRAKSTTPYNPALQTTPFLKKLSENSILIEKMFSLNTYTTDAIITIHCGNYPPNRKSTYSPIFYMGLPDLLKPYGYVTSYFTGQNLNYEHNRKLLKNIGFDDINGQNDLPKEGYLKINWTGYEEHIAFRPSLEWIDKAIESNKHFLITYLMTTSHQPYNLPESFKKIQYAHPTNKLLNNYLNSLRYVDNFLADLFNEFEKRKLMASSIFIIVGDHADSVGKGLRKSTELSYHVPCLILGPTIRGEKRVGGARQQIDIFPTILDYLGLEIKNGKLPGTSLFEDVSNDRLIFFRNWNPNDPLLIRTGPFKFSFPKDGSPPKVYNIELDPDEQRTISDQFTSEYLESIKEKYLDWHKRVNYNYYRNLIGYQPKKE